MKSSPPVVFWHQNPPTCLFRTVSACKWSKGLVSRDSDKTTFLEQKAIVIKVKNISVMNVLIINSLFTRLCVLTAAPLENRWWRFPTNHRAAFTDQHYLMQLIAQPHFSLHSQDVNWWTGVVCTTCGLLWCFYQLFGLSFWRHPFTAEDPLVSKWCNATFLQISSDEETNWMSEG